MCKMKYPEDCYPKLRKKLIKEDIKNRFGIKATAERNNTTIYEIRKLEREVLNEVQRRRYG